MDWRVTINVRPVIVQAKLSAFCYQRDKQPVLWKLDVELLPAELPALPVHSLMLTTYSLMLFFNVSFL